MTKPVVPELQTEESLDDLSLRIEEAKRLLNRANKIREVGICTSGFARRMRMRRALESLVDDTELPTLEAALEDLFNGYSARLVELGVQPPESPFQRKESESIRVVEGVGGFAFYSDGTVIFQQGREGSTTAATWDGKQWDFEGRTER